MKDSRNVFRKLGFIGAGLCAACCFLPVVGVVFGMGSLTFISGFLEIAGMVAMIGAVFFFGIYLVKSKKAPACEVDCSCRDEKATQVHKTLSGHKK